MNAYKLYSAIGALAMTMLSVGIHAQTHNNAAATVVEQPLTRAEVMADLEVWQRAGMPAFQQGESQPDESNASYVEARARYAQLRASPLFAEIVARINNKARAEVHATAVR